MVLKYVKTKDKLPYDTDLGCVICLRQINLDEITDRIPNCLICRNGHRVHHTCWIKHKQNMCPTCKSRSISFCKSSLGYSYVER